MKQSAKLAIMASLTALVASAGARLRHILTVDHLSPFADHRHGLYTMTELCAHYGVSRKTGYKWKERFLQEGLAGLGNQSRRPASSVAILFANSYFFWPDLTHS